MKLLIVFALIFSVVHAEYEKVDWPRVRPMHEFPEYWIIQGLAPRIQPRSDVSSRIVGGEDARPHQFPYTVCKIALLAHFISYK
jgi:hypothetical protein